jgi:hypothetical protein
MRIVSRAVVLLMVLCQMLVGSSRTSAQGSVKNERSEPAPSQPQAVFQVIAPRVVLQSSFSEKAAFAETQNALPKDVIILRGSALGAVKFEHKLHSQTRAAKCETCHHPSRREKPATALQQACSDCHTKVAISPMKTKLQAAFHNPTAATGTCIDCHKAETAKGKVAPVKCLGCHKKEKL